MHTNSRVCVRARALIHALRIEGPNPRYVRCMTMRAVANAINCSCVRVKQPTVMDRDENSR
jgi:hypothetical protein